MNSFWIWFVVGLIPYYVNKRQVKNGRVLHIRALFWSLEIHFQQPERHQFLLRVPLIQRLRNAAWAMINHLQGGWPPQKGEAHELLDALR